MQFLFGVQDGQSLEQFASLAQAAGLRVGILEHGSGRVQVPVVIAERRECEI